MRSPATLSIACALALSLSTTFTAVAGDSVYWERKEDGWHFYEPDPPPPPKKPKPKTPVPVTPGQPAVTVEQGPAPLSSAWLRENMQYYADLAIDNPTPENVELLAYLERVMMDKAERYSQARVQVAISNPQLDEYARSPLTAVQQKTANKTKSAAKERVLARLANRVGLWYFFSSTCPYCAQQDPILDMFQEDTGFQILSISLDGGPHASGVQKPYVINDGHAQKLGVMSTPTFVVADTESGELYNLAAGLRTYQELEERLIELGRIQGWISEIEYTEAVRGEPSRFITDGLHATGLPESKDPEALLQYLRRASVSSGQSSPWLAAPQQ